MTYNRIRNASPCKEYLGSPLEVLFKDQITLSKWETVTHRAELQEHFTLNIWNLDWNLDFFYISRFFFKLHIIRFPFRLENKSVLLLCSTARHLFEFPGILEREKNLGRRERSWWLVQLDTLHSFSELSFTNHRIFQFCFLSSVSFYLLHYITLRSLWFTRISRFSSWRGVAAASYPSGNFFKRIFPFCENYLLHNLASGKKLTFDSVIGVNNKTEARVDKASLESWLMHVN
mgnify:FL=1